MAFPLQTETPATHSRETRFRLPAAIQPIGSVSSKQSMQQASSRVKRAVKRRSSQRVALHRMRISFNSFTSKFQLTIVHHRSATWNQSFVICQPKLKCRSKSLFLRRSTATKLPILSFPSPLTPTSSSRSCIRVDVSFILPVAVSFPFDSTHFLRSIRFVSIPLLCDFFDFRLISAFLTIGMELNWN